MPYMNESALAYYDPKLKEWISAQPVKTLPSSLYPWTLTAKAGAVTCWPVGETPLEPTVDFLFTETPPSNGQSKAPDNPSTITGVSSVKIYSLGKNCATDTRTETYSDTNIEVEKNADGSFRIHGNVPPNTSHPFFNVYRNTSGDVIDKIKPGVVYTASFYSTNTACSLTLFSHTSNGYSLVFSISNDESATFTLPNDTDNDTWLRIGLPTGEIDTICKVQIELGSEATGYEPPVNRNTATISLGGTYYGGTLDVASGVMTVTHFLEQLSSSTNIVATGFSEDQSAYRVGMYLSSSKERMPYPITSLEGYACNSFPVVADPSVNSAPCFGLAGGSILTYLCLTKTMLGIGDGAAYDAVRSAVLSFLGSHQVKVAGKLATPYTVQLTPTEILSLTQSDKYTPRLNTIYTDASSVQVGYVKSPIREEFELQQAIVAQGGNI